MNLEQEGILQRIKELVQPLLLNRRVQLVEMTYRQEGSRAVLRCLVDTTLGITLDELGALNQAIGALLEEHEVIPSAYMLEVSSPGLDRPLKTSLDFERVIGRRVKVSTVVSIQSNRELSGELVGANEESILLRLDTGDKLKILLSEIAWARQEIRL